MSLTYSYNDISNNATVTGHTNKSTVTTVTIPSTFTNHGITYDVTSIGDDAFYGATSLTSVTIPDSVTSIGNYAFSRATSLTSVTIPDSVTSIGYNAFRNANSLTSVTFAENSSLETIGDWAFAWTWMSLTSITIPDSVTTIGNYAFYGANNLASVTFAENSSLETIGNHAFRETGLTSVTIPNSVTSIGNYAFRDATSLTSVTFQDATKITTVGDDVFFNIAQNPTFIFQTAFQLSELHINLKTQLNAITTKTLNFATPTGFTTTDNTTHHINITGELLSSSYLNHASINDVTDIKSVVIGTGVTSIGFGAFYLATSLTSITIPNSVTSIGYAAFGAANSLTSVTIPNSVTSIGGNAFFDSGLTSVTIPNSVTSIGDGAFYNANSLTSVTIPNSVTSIGRNAFAYTGLTSVTIPNSVTSIGDGAFRQTDLTSVTIPDSVTSIGYYAFNGASSLTSVTFKDATQITTFGDDVFSGIAQNPTFTFQTATSLPSALSGKLPGDATLVFPDSVAPVITLNGAATMTVEVGSNYNDAGATVSDNVDANVTVSTTDTVDINTVGTYTVTYNATDNANNPAIPVTRTVHVVRVGHAPVCFLAGTPIQTNQGKIPIEKLNPKIHTIRGKTIQAITKTITPDDSLICFEPNSLGNQLPSQKTVISMNHKILYQGKMTKAKYFVGNVGIYKIPYKQQTLYNVLLDSHDKMIVNNMICETLDPRNTIAQLYMSLKHIPEEKHASVFSQYNAFCKVHNIYGTDSSRPKSKGAAFRPNL